MGAVNRVLSFEAIDLVKDFLNPVMMVEQLLLDGFGHAHLSLEVLGQFLVIQHVAISLPLEYAQMTYCIRSALIDVCYSQFCLLIFVTQRVKVHLQVSINLVV